MGDFLRNNPALILALVLGWFTYGAFNTEMPRAKAGDKPGDIDARKLETRPAGARAVKIASPFAPWEEPPEPGRTSNLPPAGAWLVDPVASARETFLAAGTRTGPLYLLASLGLRSLLPGLGQIDTLTASSGELAQVELPGDEVHPSFTLELEALLALSGGKSTARISGRDVRPGGEIEGFDPISPPLVLQISGTRVVIDYRGEQVVLDLDTQRSAHFGPEITDG